MKRTINSALPNLQVCLGTYALWPCGDHGHFVMLPLIPDGLTQTPPPALPPLSLLLAPEVSPMSLPHFLNTEDKDLGYSKSKVLWGSRKQQTRPPEPKGKGK